MLRTTGLLKATALALPLAFGATAAAQAADIVATLQQRDDFSRLAQAIQQAGLQDALSGEGPFTVFAPTNEAFNQLPQGAIEQLDQQQLQQLLQHHVVEGEAIASDEIPERLDPMAGGRIDVSLAGDEILLYSAPPVGQQGQQQAAAGGQQGGQQQVQQVQQQLQQADQALQQQDVQQAQQALDQAQQALDQALQQAQGQQQQQLQQVQQQLQQASQALQQQDVQGAQQALQQAQQPLQQLAQQGGGQQQQGQQATGGAMTTGIERVTVAEGDIEADNGVIHAISGVLVPPDMEQALRQQGGQQQGQQPTGGSGQQGQQQGQQ